MNLAGALKTSTRLAKIDQRLRAATSLPTVTPISVQDLLAIASESAQAAVTKADQPQIDSSEIAEVLAESLRLQLSLAQFLSERRSLTMASLAGSLRRIGTPTDGRTFPQQVCAELISVGGFGSALFCTVDGPRLKPRAHDFATEGSAPCTLDAVIPAIGSVEQQCLTVADEPIRSGPVTSTPAVSDFLGTTDYVIAPVVVGTSVVATIHVGQIIPLSVEPEDIEVLGIYRDTVSATFVREMWARKVKQHHQAVHNVAHSLVADIDRIVNADLEIDYIASVEAIDPVNQPAAAHPALERLLTTREAEVMRLIAAGASNAEIAERLFIGIETVKSHVKKILRKIGAVNRSEAISLYLDRT